MRRIVELFVVVALFAVRTMAGPAPGADLFTNGPLLHVEIQLGKEAADSLRRDSRKPVKCDVKEGATLYTNVAIHIKGAAGSTRGFDDRPALTLDFNKFVPKQKFHGLSKIHLNNSVQDPAMLDERICGEIARAAGVPAARTAHVMLKLRERDMGVYVLKEGFTKEFVGQYFELTDGNFYDGGFCADIDSQLHKTGGSGPEDRSDLKALIAATREPDPKLRWQKLTNALAIEPFISMMVVDAITVNWDGYTFKPNNYRLYVNPADHKVTFIPHGMDQMFGRGGDTSVFTDGSGMVARAVLSTPEGRARYKERMKQTYTEVFDAKALANRVTELAKPIRAELKGDSQRWYDSEVSGLRERITYRAKFVGEEIKRVN